jgi:hypothetical protein
MVHSVFFWFWIEFIAGVIAEGFLITLLIKSIKSRS